MTQQFDRDLFRRKVKKEIKSRGLTWRERRLFAARCALRVLPILGHRGNFNFWRNEKRQRYLFAVLRAVDTAAANTADDDAAYAADAAANAAYAVADAAAYAAYAAAYAAANATNATYATAAAANAAAYAAQVFNRYAYHFFDPQAKSSVAEQIEELILADIQAVKEDQPAAQTSPEIYGEFWDNFANALCGAGCDYWLAYYEKPFRNGFVFDPAVLKRHLAVPREIRENGAAEVGRYLRGLAGGAERLDEARVIILGDKGAGKTSIARKLMHPNASMPKEHESTVGVDTTLWEIKNDRGETVNVRIWDFAGHVVTHAAHRFFLSERCFYILVYDGRTERREQLNYWLNHIKDHGGDSKTVILVNRRDEHQTTIPINNLRDNFKLHDRYFEFSIKDNEEKLKEFTQFTIGEICGNPSWNRQEMPAHTYRIKERLEGDFRSRDYIEQQRFAELAREEGVADKKGRQGVLKDLHALGLCLWYREIDRLNTLVLNPEWISAGVYQTINWLNDRKKDYRLSLAELSKVFGGDEEQKRYPQEQHRFLYDLIKHYEMAYETNEAGSGEQYLILPHLMPEDRPETLPDFPVGESLMMKYIAEGPLPAFSVSRFIVRQHGYLRQGKKTAWRYGAILQKGQTTALVREEDRTLSVSVKGPEATDFLSELRTTLNDIFESYKSKTPELHYRIDEYGKKTQTSHSSMHSDKPVFIKDQIAREIAKRGEDNFIDPATGQPYPISIIGTQYNLNLPITNSFNKTLNFNNCVIGLQGNLNELAGDLLATGTGKNEAENLCEAARAIGQAERLKDNPEALKKSGLMNKVKRVLEDWNDEQSELHQKTKAVRNGIRIAQEIGEGYNEIAQWCGLPQIPKPFLNIGRKKQETA